MFETKFRRVVKNVGIKAAMAAVWWGTLALVGLLNHCTGQPDATVPLVILGGLLPVAWLIVETRKE